MKAPTLLAVVIVGVIVGTLSADYIRQRIAAQQAAAAVAAFTQQIEEIGQRERAAQQARQEQIKTERRFSTRGRQLAATCAEWQRADERYSVPSSRENAQKHCARYLRFLETGT